MSLRIRGFALMLAVFLIVTLAAIGLYLLTVSTGQVLAVAQDEQAARAYQAARAGIERAIYERLINNSSCSLPAIQFTNPGLSGFRAEVTCSQLGPETEGTATVNVYQITVLACNTGAVACTPSPATPASSTYVERALSVTITQTL